MISARWALGLASLLAATALAGCSADRAAAPSLPSGRSDATIEVDGTTRTYHVYRPAAVTAARPTALVVMLHGGFGSGAQAQDTYGWDAAADAHGFVVAYPDGQNRAWNVGGGCCGMPGRDGVDDVAFVTAMVGAIRDRIAIDPRRVFVTGISNGGMLSYRLACAGTLFAAAAPVAATLLGDCPAPHPISLLHVHGTADESVRYLGGPGSGVARIDGPAVPQVVADWRRVDACAPPAQTTTGPVTTSVSTCAQGRAVELVTIAGAGHQWPGSGPRTPGQRLLGLDPPSTALDATATIWAFFQDHPAPA